MPERPIRLLSFGGGVQSVTLARMALDGELEPLDAMIFADPGAELPGTYEAVRQIEAACHNRGVAFHRVTNAQARSSGNLYDDLMSTKDNGRWSAPPLFIRNPDGSVGFSRRQCTGDFKIDPIERMIRLLAGVGRRRKFPDGPVVEQWLGISADEKQRMRVSTKAWQTLRYPLIERNMHRADCIRWLQAGGYPVPPKSACFFCPYQSDARWRQMRDEQPEYWAKAVALDERLRSETHLMTQVGKPHLHRKAIPLAEVDLRTAAERGQIDLFDDECAGVCGV